MYFILVDYEFICLLTLTQNASHIIANLLLKCRLTQELAAVKLDVTFVGNSLRWKNSTLSVCAVIIFECLYRQKYNTVSSLVDIHLSFIQIHTCTKLKM